LIRKSALSDCAFNIAERGQARVQRVDAAEENATKHRIRRVSQDALA
jgi:hypothetical protein